jgi:Cu/Ag efflux protein CusF
MQLWKVVLLLNVALVTGIGLGYLRSAREVRRLEDQVGRLQAEAARSSLSSWTVRGIVRVVVPQAKTVFLTHEAVPGLMEAMTMGFEAENAKTLNGLTPGDPVRFRVRKEGDRLVLVSIEKLRAP